MNVYFWGTRGSLPISVTAKDVRAKIVAAFQHAAGKRFSDAKDTEHFIDTELPFAVKGTYGCNTSCIEIRGGEEYIICDAGTGLRDFGKDAITKGGGKKAVYNIFLSHLHWDHIQGFPFFIPAFVPGNRIQIYSLHQECKETFIKQQQSPTFPVPLEYMQAEITFNILDPQKEYSIGGWSVSGMKQNHPGDSYGYCFKREGKKIIYSTDSEHKDDVWQNEDVIKFFQDADLLIFDAQYSFMEAVDTKESWGHSSNLLGVELSVVAKVKHLCLFHNEPACDDQTLDKFLEDTRNYLKLHAPGSDLVIDLAYDGLQIDL